MSDIQPINLNRVEVKPADTSAPIALEISWNPINPDRANFKTQKIVVDGLVIGIDIFLMHGEWKAHY